MNTIRWGLLSTARINRRLIPAIRSAALRDAGAVREAGRSKLLAVASRDPARAEAYAAEWDIPRAHGSYAALLADPQIDAVYISLPNNLHAEWTVRAARAGKHVLCEKPLALNVAECDQISAAAEENNVVVLEAVMYLHHPLLHKARELVRDGAVGRVTLVRGAFTFFLDRSGDVRRQPELGGGSLWDVGSYPVSFIRWMLGEPTQVFGWQTLGASGVDETFAGVLRYADGALGVFDCGFQGAFRAQAEVVGAHGRLVIERPFPTDAASRIVWQRGDQEQVITAPESDPYRCEVEALAAAVLDGAPPPVPLSSSRANVATLAALYESAQKGEPVKLEA